MCITKLLYNHTKFDTTYIKAGNRRLKVWLANSPRRMMLGLMHRTSLKGADGMLFFMGRSARHGIWMPHMNFAIDIVWISEEGMVVDVFEDAEPCTKMFGCPIYKPREDAFYILEIASGRASRLGIKRGSKVLISNNEY